MKAREGDLFGRGKGSNVFASFLSLFPGARPTVSAVSAPNSEIITMAKTNYAFEKRQRDLQKKKKKEEKQKRKTENSSPQSHTPEAEQTEGDLPEADAEQSSS
jgi:3'-phosphoadenosine 5'-phosphosulfate (PAPS) 3'-phosphatase